MLHELGQPGEKLTSLPRLELEKKVIKAIGHESETEW